ncbi:MULTISPECIES: hypothetical protein [unclassified Leifsonia]|uniref:hypothetical protein n=1 Tax=unclassified Leifsonia TaxID=2663824 RepID=UPI0006F5B879|nr:MULTISPECIES: hypothetical protein [unclassified Leifsonia]KQX07438.1 hypothetical protein ASC59_06655 [Leifsonia sp. Root1293]KRA11720.1 hypothetical protein ASD61_06655 [Leifsonia sp. Root60]
MNDDNGLDPDTGLDASDGLDPVARLRAVDPAAGVEPRAGFVDEVVAASTGVTAGWGTVRSGAVGSEAVTDDPAGEPAPVTDLGAERRRRRPRWIPIAAVAASIAIFGAAGYAVGASSAGTSNLADGAAPPISLQGAPQGMSPGAQEGAATDGAGSAPSIAVPEPSGSRKMAGTADMMYPSGFGRSDFTSSGLSTDGGSAAGYAFDPRASSNAETVGALAAAFGLEGVPELKDGVWFVGSQDGTAPGLMVSLDGTLSYSYSNPTINPWDCTETDETGACVPSGDGTVPGEEAAIQALRSLIAATGQDPEAFQYGSETWEGALTRTAQAWPVVDGQRVDQPWSLELATEGIVNAYGGLATIVPVGDYEVVSAQEAFERLSDPRFGARMSALPVALMRTAEGSAGSDAADEWIPPTEPPATPTTGAPLSWPVTRVDIVGARLGLASQWQPDGSVVVVPAYELTDAEGGTWSVIAVADSMLDFATE